MHIRHHFHSGISLFRKIILKLLSLKCQARGRKSKIRNEYIHIKDSYYRERERERLNTNIDHLKHFQFIIEYPELFK